MGGQAPSRRPTKRELDDLLQEGIDAARSGYNPRARDLLLQVLEQQPSSVPAWLWLSDVVDTPAERELCLEQVLGIDPGHVVARRGLGFLRRQQRGRELSPVQEQRSEMATARMSSNKPELAAAAAPTEPATRVGPRGSADTSLEGLREAEAPDIRESTLTSTSPQVVDVDDLMRPAIAAARSGHVQRARELLSWAITLDETHVSAWMWLSYIATDEEERERCLRKVLALAVPGMTLTPAPAGAIGPVPAMGQQGPGSAVSGRTLARAPAGAIGPAPAMDRRGTGPAVRLKGPPRARRPWLPDVARFDRAGLTSRLHALHLEWATTWTFIAWAYMAVIAVAEILTAFGPPRAGMVAHAIALLVILFHAARVEAKREQAFLVSLAFAPLIRVISLSLPLAELPLLYWYPITSIPLFVAALIAAPTLGFSWPDLGLNLRRWGLQLAIGLVGIAFGVCEYLILRPAPLVSVVEWTDILWPALILLIATGLLEEIIFRGLLQRAAMNLLGFWGLAYVAILFSVLHVGYRSLLDVLFVGGVGLFFGWVVHRTRSLLGVTLAHGLTNVMLFLIMPFILG